MIRRHSKTAIFLHWFNAACWIGLLATGFALLAPGPMQPVGRWWAELWTGALGAWGLLQLHVVLGLAWAGVYLLASLLTVNSEVVPFLREITRISLASDLRWCLGKGLNLVLGAKAMRSMGLDPALPPQGFYNAGQKLVAVAAVACSLLLVATGVLQMFSRGLTGLEGLVQWALLIHLCCAGLMAVLLPVHIYMAALAPGEGPALRSMFTGFVPEDFARHHNPLWHDQLKSGDR